MGIHITDDSHVAIFDSVTGYAFGPTFNGDEQAQHFLTWTEEQALPDPRTWSPINWEANYAEWYAATHDEDGDWIEDLGDDFGDDEIDDAFNGALNDAHDEGGGNTPSGAAHP